ncbi:MAG: hypothetical protein L0K56_08470, partial [Corynebacterium sp.]|nr:hypothetical protein [Corynebacterium sp.]
MDPNTAFTALRAARQVSSSLGGDGRRKKGDVRDVSGLYALRPRAGSGARARGPQDLSSAPGHHRLIVEQLLAENRAARQPASPTSDKDDSNTASKGITVSNATKNDTTQGLDQAVQEAESALDTLKDSKAEKLSKKASKATKKADKISSKADKRRAKADKTQAKALKRQHKVAKKAAGRNESPRDFVEKRVSAVTSAAGDRANALADQVRHAPDADLTDTVTRWGRTAAERGGELFSQAQERGSAFLESDAVSDALDDARDRANHLGKAGAALAATGVEAGRKAGKDAEKSAKETAKKSKKQLKKNHGKDLKAAKKKADKAGNSARKSLESAWSQASEVASEVGETAKKEGAKGRKQASKQAKKAKKAKKFAQKNAKTANKQLSRSQRKIKKTASKKAEKVRAKELKKAAKANRKKHTGRNILLLAIIAAAVAFVAQKAKGSGSAAPSAPAKTP